ALEPIDWNPRCQHQRLFALALISEHVEHRANVIRGNPRVRHVADETGLSRLPADDFRPLVPRRGALVLKEVFKKLVRAITPAEPHEAPSDAKLIGGVGVPTHFAVAAVREVAPIALERRSQEIVGYVVLLARGCQGDGCRGGVKVTKVSGAGHVEDAVNLGGGAHRGMEIAPELVLRLRKFSRGAALAERFGDGNRIFVTEETPEHVPVRIRRLARVALVADGRRKQAKEHSALRGEISWGALRRPQAVHVAHGRFDMRPRRLQQRPVARIAKDFGGEEDKLSVTIVLGNWIRAPRIDAARNLAVFELVRSEPA